MKLTWPRNPLKASRAAQTDVQPHHTTQGIGQDWTNPHHAQYMATSMPVYTAVRVRSNAIARVPWDLSTPGRRGERIPVPTTHPASKLMLNPNPWFPPAALRRATEIHLCLWGKAFWSIETSAATGLTELWPLRPDKMTVLPGKGRGQPYIRGYLYTGDTGETVAYLPEEIEYFSYFNPLEPRSGLSPMAPMRLSADMALDALRYNRNTFRNGAIPDYILLAEDGLTEEQIALFYQRWENRFNGPDKAHRPAIASGIKTITNLAFSNRDLEYLASLKWTLADASRAYGVPLTMMAELGDATLANMGWLESQFWRDTVKPEATLLQDQINTSLLPKLGFPNVELTFDFSGVEALAEAEDLRIKRETDFLDRGVLTINEVRRTRGLGDVTWGNEPRFRDNPPPAAESPRLTPGRTPKGQNGHASVEHAL